MKFPDIDWSEVKRARFRKHGGPRVQNAMPCLDIGPRNRATVRQNVVEHIVYAGRTNVFKKKRNGLRYSVRWGTTLLYASPVAP